MTKSSRPPLDPEAARELVEPSARDRDRIRENIDRAMARGSASETVLRVDASMAERALGVAARASIHGSKLALAKLIVPAVLIGAGVGSIWARSLFAPQPRSEPASQSLPVQVEDLTDDDVPSTGEFEPVFEVSPPTAASMPVKHHAKAAHRAHTASIEAHSLPTPAASAAPAVVTEADPGPSPEAPSHHLAEELRLMRAASAALTANDVPRTLNLLSQHAERFPDGALREERRALRVISLCKQGRSHFALVERDEFLSSSPRSPLTARVREACELPK